MRIIPLIRRTTNRRFLRWAGVSSAMLFLGAAFGQEAAPSATGSDVVGPYPRLPGAVTKAPEGLDANAPFDIKKLFPALPSSQNAAPLYLDALFEFGAEMSVCFPPGPATERRRQAAADRSKRYLAFYASFAKDPKLVSTAAIDEVIKLYDTGFRKLAEAQRRNRCMFESGLGVASPVPHVQASRQVARIAALRAQRAVDRRDLDGAIGEIEPVLRLARDLQPRGAEVNQLVLAAVSNYLCVEIVDRILAAPGLQAVHCDRLLRVFAAHESKCTDGYSEGLRVRYLMTRITVRDLIKRPAVIAKEMDLKKGESVVNAMAAAMLGGGKPVGFQPFASDADAQIARTSPAQLAVKVRELSRYHATLLDLERMPYADRIAKSSVFMLAGNDLLSRLLMLMTPNPESFMRGISLATTSIRATECLIALRRWQLGHRGEPRDIATAIKGSPLKTVPLDPYDGRPMRLAFVDGQPVVYSVGRDGKDDGGRIDSNRDMKPSGDLIYRLPPASAR
jgi:hypothetical protein